MKLVAVLTLLLCTWSGAQQRPTSAPSTGTVQGTVIDPEGIPVADASVYYELRDTPAPGHPRTVATDKSGAFILEGVAAGKVSLGAFKESASYNYSIFAFNAPPRTSMLQVEVKPGETRRNLIIHLAPKAGLLRLRVLDAATRQPLSQIRFQLCRADHADDIGYCLGGGGSPSASDGDLSQFVPPSVPISIKLSALNYTNWTYKDQDTGSSLLTLKSGETRVLTIYLRADGAGF